MTLQSAMQQNENRAFAEIFQEKILEVESQIVCLDPNGYDNENLLRTLKVQRRAYLAQKVQAILAEAARTLLTQISEYHPDVSALRSTAEIRQQLHKQVEYAENWQKIVEMPDYGDRRVKQIIDDTKAFVQCSEQDRFAILETEYHVLKKKRNMPCSPRAPEEHTEAFLEMELEMEMDRLQRDLGKIQQIASSLPQARTSTVKQDARKAALYLKQQLSATTYKVDGIVAQSATNLSATSCPVQRSAVEDEVSARPSLTSVLPTGPEKSTKSCSGEAETKAWLDFEATDEQGRLEYIGEICQDREHGLGTMKWIDDTQYKGEFCDGVLHGFGLELYPSSNGSYKGQFARNFRHGLGVFSSPHGEQYSGEWVLGERQGYGIIRKTKHGQSKQVFALFEKGDIVKILEDSEHEASISRSVQDVVRQALEMVRSSVLHSEFLTFV